jgi:hypothetical protein
MIMHGRGRRRECLHAAYSRPVLAVVITTVLPESERGRCRAAAYCIKCTYRVYQYKSQVSGMPDYVGPVKIACLVFGQYV